MAADRTRLTLRRSRAFVLLTTMLLIALMTAVTAQVVTVGAVGGAVGARRDRTLQHDLALESGLLLIEDILAGPSAKHLLHELDRFGTTGLRFAIGDVEIRGTLRDEGAKFHPRWFNRPDQEPLLSRVLTRLGSRSGLAPAQVDLKPVATASRSDRTLFYHWFDQLLADVQPGQILRLHEDEDLHPTWSDVVTLWGDGRVDLRRSDAAVLDAALSDLQPGLADAMLQMRPADRTINFLRSALERVPAELRQTVSQRVGFDLRRYAIEVDTIIGADRRRWFVVAGHRANRLEVLHRGMVTW